MPVDVARVCGGIQHFPEFIHTSAFHQWVGLTSNVGVGDSFGDRVDVDVIVGEEVGVALGLGLGVFVGVWKTPLTSGPRYNSAAV
jgi:hypothetical protein